MKICEQWCLASSEPPIKHNNTAGIDMSDKVKVYSTKQVTLDVIKEAQKSAPVIGTHNGTFHCDEVTACVLLKTLDKWKDSAIIRTREDNLLQQCDIVIDNGHIFDPEKNRFDHHQRDFEITWSEKHTKTKLSSAGLIFKHFGREVLEQAFKVDPQDSEYLQNELYELIFESIDANDNGVKSCECKDKRYTGGVPGYGGLISSCNTSWIISDKMDESICFANAYETAKSHLLRVIRIFANNYLKAKEEFSAAITKRDTVHPSRLVILIEQHYRFARYLHRFYQREGQDENEVVPQIVVWKEPWGTSEQVDWAAEIIPTEWDSTVRSMAFPTRTELEDEQSAAGKSDDGDGDARKVFNASNVHMLTKSRLVCGSKECLFAILEKTLNSKVAAS